MDCCGSSKPKEDKDVKENPTEKDTGKDAKAGTMGHENSPAEKEQTHGCCGGAKDMWLHLIIMLIVFAAVWFLIKK